MGAEVYGVSLEDNEPKSHYKLLKNLNVREYIQDIRDFDSIQKIIKDVNPDIIFHMAAQALVIPSYHDPLEAWSTNVMGTAHILEAARAANNVRAVISVTTDKCYKNKEWEQGYTEQDELGGSDPYSASKAGSELVIESYRQSFYNKTPSRLLASVRAGNVVGGGDWAEYRLIPDIIRAVESDSVIEVRNPMSVRPWQHVLESLSGYLLLGQKMIEGVGATSSAWNFGPDTNDTMTVQNILNQFQNEFDGLRWNDLSDKDKLHETNYLKLDSSKSKTELNWQPIWSTSNCIQKTIDWYKSWMQGDLITENQINAYISDARNNKIEWALYD